MSESRAPYITAQPFAAGDTVYHRWHGQGIVDSEDSAEWWVVTFPAYGQDIYRIETLSRTPWDLATPTQCPHGYDHATGCLTCQLANAPTTPADDRDRLIADLRAQVAIYEAALDALDKASDNLPGYEGMRGFVGVENDDDGVQCLVKCEHDWHSDGKTITYATRRRLPARRGVQGAGGEEIIMSAVTWDERMAGIEKRRMHREQRERERAEELAAAEARGAAAERARIVGIIEEDLEDFKEIDVYSPVVEYLTDILNRINEAEAAPTSAGANDKAGEHHGL